MINLITLFLLPLLGRITQASFPEVLSIEDENKYLERLKNNDKEARTVLIEHNLRLVAHIVKKFENTNVEYEDLLSIGTFGLIKAIDTFNHNANVKLATYASRCIENEILMYLRSIKKHKDVVSLYSPIGIDKEGNEIHICDIIEDPTPSIVEQLINKEKVTKLYQAIKKLSKQEYDIIVRRYGLFEHKIETQKNIAKDLKISRSYVSRIEKRALTKLYLYLKE